MSGRFISLEGGEGVGKSTQLLALAAALRHRGQDVVTTREPGGSAGAEAIRTLLLEGEDERWSVRSEALLFAAGRCDHVERTIWPALQSGAWVLCDRFVDSSLVYQGLVGGAGEGMIRDLHRLATDDFLPDRTLLLQLPVEEADRRARHRDRMASDRFGSRDAAYHAQIAAAFSALAAQQPDRFRVVDASGEPASVTQRLVGALQDLL